MVEVTNALEQLSLFSLQNSSKRTACSSTCAPALAAIKEKADWKCQKCGIQCLKPNDKIKGLTKSERAKLTLTVHHKNY